MFAARDKTLTEISLGAVPVEPVMVVGARECSSGPPYAIVGITAKVPRQTDMHVGRMKSQAVVELEGGLIERVDWLVEEWTEPEWCARRYSNVCERLDYINSRSLASVQAPVPRVRSSDVMIDKARSVLYEEEVNGRITLLVKLGCCLRVRWMKPLSSRWVPAIMAISERHHYNSW
jgi:hypothetical protein